MPWLPELFSTPVVEQRCDDEIADWERLEAVPYYDGLTAGEHDALIRSFAGEPVLHDPLRRQGHGRAGVRGLRHAAELVARGAQHVVPAGRGRDHPDAGHSRRWFSTCDGEAGTGGRAGGDRGGTAGPTSDSVELPRVPQHAAGGGPPCASPPMLQRDPELRASDVVAEHLHALADGASEAILATFEPEPADGLRARYERLFSNGGGIRLDHCALVDTGHACALEYNVVGWGTAERRPGGRCGRLRPR